MTTAPRRRPCDGAHRASPRRTAEFPDGWSRVPPRSNVMMARMSAWSAGISNPPEMMARAPSASSVVAPTRSRPSLILNGICADATDNAPDDSTGSTICRSLVSSVACPLSLARIATSKARGSSPAIPADSSVTVPLPDNRAGQRRRAAALARQRHLQRGAARRHGEAAIVQRRAIDGVELNARIERNSVGAGSGVDTGARLAAADAALDGVECQRLAVALDRSRSPGATRRRPAARRAAPETRYGRASPSTARNRAARRHRARRRRSRARMPARDRACRGQARPRRFFRRQGSRPCARAAANPTSRCPDRRRSAGCPTARRARKDRYFAPARRMA